MDQKQIIGIRLKEIREKREIDKSDAADMLEVNYSTYSNWEAGNREPSAAMLIKMADFYEVSLDYLYGRDVAVNDKLEKELETGPIAGLISEFKKAWNKRDRAVQIKGYWYDKLLQEAGYDPNKVNSRLNGIIAGHYQRIEDKYEAELRAKEEEELLDHSLNLLNKLLAATKKGSIQIGLTNGRIGMESWRDVFRLADYKISMDSKIITLAVEKEGEEWTIIFDNIIDIRYSDLSRNSSDKGTMKIWIYMQHITWRFYLNYNISDVKEQ